MKLDITKAQYETIKEAIGLAQLHNDQDIQKWGNRDGKSNVEPNKTFIRESKASNKRLESLAKRLMI
jgi:hypothetical protein